MQLINEIKVDSIATITGVTIGTFKGVCEIENKWKAELSELAKNYQNT